MPHALCQSMIRELRSRRWLAELDHCSRSPRSPMPCLLGDDQCCSTSQPPSGCCSSSGNNCPCRCWGCSTWVGKLGLPWPTSGHEVGLVARIRHGPCIHLLPSGADTRDCIIGRSNMCEQTGGTMQCNGQPLFICGFKCPLPSKRHARQVSNKLMMWFNAIDDMKQSTGIKPHSTRIITTSILRPSGRRIKPVVDPQTFGSKIPQTFGSKISTLWDRSHINKQNSDPRVEPELGDLSQRSSIHIDPCIDPQTLESIVLSPFVLGRGSVPLCAQPFRTAAHAMAIR